MPRAGPVMGQSPPSPRQARGPSAPVDGFSTDPEPPRAAPGDAPGPTPRGPEAWGAGGKKAPRGGPGPGSRPAGRGGPGFPGGVFILPRPPGTAPSSGPRR